MIANLTGYSKGLYSSWFFYKPGRFLLDAGEGISLALGKKIFGIRQVFLSHGHEDHIAGLPSLVNLRNLSSGTREKAIDVYYPKGDPYIAYLMDYLEKKQRNMLRYELAWHGLYPGDSVAILGAKRPMRVVAFGVNHTPNWNTLGYRVDGSRDKLKSEFEGKTDAEIGEHIRARGRDAVIDRVWQPLLAYTGDAKSVHNPSCLFGVHTLLVDCTYLSEAENTETGHGDIMSAFTLAKVTQARELVLAHVSDRYSMEEVHKAVTDATMCHQSPSCIGFFFGDQYYKI